MQLNLDLCNSRHIDSLSILAPILQILNLNPKSDTYIYHRMFHSIDELPPGEKIYINGFLQFFF